MINITTKPPVSKELFFSNHDGISRLDLTYDASFKKLAEQDESNMWFLNVVSCTNDRWYELPPEALSKFQKNLAYQTVLDSLVPDVFSYLAEIISDPYASYLYSRISTMEKIHAMSYSSAADQAFGAKATEFLDIIYTDPKIKQRIELELDIATKFINAVHAGWEETEENKQLLVRLITIIFLLEGIKFPFSFFTSWTINRAFNNCAQGFSQLLIKISVDEMQVHVTAGKTVLKRLSKSPKFKHLFESGWFAALATELATEVFTRESDWADYLLIDGEVPGFNKAITDHFLKYWVNRRLNELGLDPLFPNIVKNDVEIWFDEYRSPNSKQSALQEVDNISYQLGQVINDLHRFDTDASA